jgi:nucleolar protein 14
MGRDVLHFFRLCCIRVALELLSKVESLYQDKASYVELFSRFGPLFASLQKTKNLPFAAIVSSLSEKVSSMTEKSMRIRRPSQLFSGKAPTLKQYNPRFQDQYFYLLFLTVFSFTFSRDNDPDEVRREEKQVKKLLKKETKGATRELRKDNWFINAEKMKKRKVEDTKREEQRKKIYASLQNEQAEANELKKEKKKKNRKSAF